MKPQFSSIWSLERTLMCYHYRPVWTWERWQWRGTLYSPKLQHYWNYTIRLFSVIAGHSLGRGLIPLQRSSQWILQPQPNGQTDAEVALEHMASWSILAIDSLSPKARCNVNYANHCQVSQHVYQVTLPVIDSVDPNVLCNVNLCLSLFGHPAWCQAVWCYTRSIN